MQQNWVIDVLTDLRSFARLNGLPQLADHLDATIRLARSEIAQSTAAPGLRPATGALDGTAGDIG